MFFSSLNINGSQWHLQQQPIKATDPTLSTKTILFPTLFMANPPCYRFPVALTSLLKALDSERAQLKLTRWTPLAAGGVRNILELTSVQAWL